MPRPQASRLQGSSRKRSGFLTEYLPYGSLQRKLAFYAGIPILSFIIFVLIVDRMVMPVVTRHGEEFALPNFVDRSVLETQGQLSELGLDYEISSQEY